MSDDPTNREELLGELLDEQGLDSQLIGAEFFPRNGVRGDRQDRSGGRDDERLPIRICATAQAFVGARDD